MGVCNVAADDGFRPALRSQEQGDGVVEACLRNKETSPRGDYPPLLKLWRDDIQRGLNAEFYNLMQANFESLAQD